jgi:hypothetical protein
MTLGEEYHGDVLDQQRDALQPSAADYTVSAAGSAF